MSSEAELSQKGLSRSTYSATSLIQNQQAYSRDGRVRARDSAAGRHSSSRDHSAVANHPGVEQPGGRPGGGRPAPASRKDGFSVLSDSWGPLPTHPARGLCASSMPPS